MSLKNLAALGCVLLLQACGIKQFTPHEYPLRAGLIAPIEASGPVNVTNAQDSTEQAVVFSYGGNGLQTNYHAVTELMVQQTTKELQKASHIGDGKPKSMALKVSFLESDYAGFHYRSKIVVQAALGDGSVVDLTVTHASGDPIQDLNGCVAEAVMKLLNDARIHAYLAS